MEDMQRAIGRRIRRLRRERGWTQADLAERTDLSLDMIGRVERGNATPSLRSLKALACALGVPPMALLADDGVPAGVAMPRARRYAYLIERLESLDDAELDWVIGLLESALRHPRRSG